MNPNPYQLRSAHHNTEAYYQLGLSLRAQGKLDEAYDAFYQAIWDYAFHSAAYYQLAELSCRKQNFTSALEQIEQSLSTNALNIKALNIKAVILRKLKRFEETKQIVVDVLYNTSCYQNLLDQSCQPVKRRWDRWAVAEFGAKSVSEDGTCGTGSRAQVVWIVFGSLI